MPSPSQRRSLHMRQPPLRFHVHSDAAAWDASRVPAADRRIRRSLPDRAPLRQDLPRLLREAWGDILEAAGQPRGPSSPGEVTWLRTSLPSRTPPAPTTPCWREIQNRVLWLACHMVDYANNERPNPTGLKVGGHQASSASVVTAMTYMFFEYMRAGDRISVKPHSSPVFHAIQYLLGNLDAEYLKALRGLPRPPGVPQPHEGPGRGRLLHGLRGARARWPRTSRGWPEEYVRDHLDPNSGA